MSTLSGNTISSTYPSLLRVDNFTGVDAGTLTQVVDGLGNRTPMLLSGTKVRFRDLIELEPNTQVDFTGGTINMDNSDIDFTLVNTTGMTKNVAVKDAGGRQQGIEGFISYSGGTGISITEDVATNTFTWEATSTDATIIFVGSGITTTAGKALYWDGTEWGTAPLSTNAADKLIGISVGTNTLNDGVIISGLVTLGAQTGYTAGALYLAASGGAFSTSPDYTDGNAQRGVGHSLGSLGIVLNPDIYYTINTDTSYLTTNLDEVLITNDGFALEYN